MESAKRHIEEIRRDTFWIGVGKFPEGLSKSLRMAVKYLSDELYSKDVHFLMELIQNAEDNEYSEGVEPSLEFLITSRDITATGAAATLLIFNNEKGFSRRNIESVCRVGDSTKAGNRKRGYIGEKGIGFKSVFLLTATPYIYSNGYQIRFSEKPCPDCDIAYIVPEWVDNKPCVSEIQEIYGPRKALPTTTLILPLKLDKIQAVKEQLSTLHPELLLFLSKIKRLCVKEDNGDPKRNSVRAVSISSERDFMTKKNIDAESYTVHLATDEVGEGKEEECRYYMWRQRFPVKAENKVEKRNDIEEWSITLAFPYGKRLNRGMSCPGIYAFLPTETVTNLPFIIQADFLLPSSRETILWDNKWNQGILDCVPIAFVNAFVSLVKSSADAPASSLASMLLFLPLSDATHLKLNMIRDSIKEKLLQENIIISESHSNQKFFHKPSEVGRLMPGFWKILLKAKAHGVKLHNLSSQGTHILHSSFDTSKYNDALNFLGIKFVDSDWYPKCIKSCNLVDVGEDVYMELLCFVAKNWKSHFDKATMKSMPLLKYVNASGNISLLTVNEALGQPYTLCLSERLADVSWLIDWSTEFINESKLVFLPKKTHENLFEVDIVLQWMKDHANVMTLDVAKYSNRLKNSLGRSCSRVVIAYAHFLYHSHAKKLLYDLEVKGICSQMPLLDRYGGISVGRKAVLVPANGSKWVDLLGSNPWRDEEFMELSEDYLHSGKYARQHTPQNVLIKFLRQWAGASDIPEICPPNSDFPTVSAPLTKENVFLLLDWVKYQRSRGIVMPKKFVSCIKNGNWLRVRINGSPNYKPPSQSFLPSSSWGNLLQNGSDMVDIPLVDQQFYDNKLLTHYKDELKEIGVMFECQQACEFIGRHLMSLAAMYSLTSTKVIAMLNFIRFLRTKYLPVDEFINSVRDGKWVRTSCGERTPRESVLYSESWQLASTISNIPFIDQEYYRKDIVEYRAELELLGVLVDVNENYQIVIDHVKSANDLKWLTAKSLLFALECISNSLQANRLIMSLKSAKCLKTNIGYLCPAECFLFDRDWVCLLEVFDDLPCIDYEFYGDSIFLYKDALAKIGVVVEFDGVVKKFCTVFKARASSKSFTKDNALKFIACCRSLKNARRTLPEDLRECMREVKWMKTRLGDYRSPKDCILFSTQWHSISQITLLPFVDDSMNGYGEGVHEWKDELKSMGVVTDLNEGSLTVLAHIFFPQDPKEIRPDSLISFVKCIRNTKPESFPEGFLQQVQKSRWLKSTIGYKSPQECMLYNKPKFLQLCDGPFIDEKYYGPLISYKEELAALGVIVDLSSSNANSMLAKHLTSLTEFAEIERIYMFLNDANWKPDNGADKCIWYPTSSDDGIWVSPSDCVLQDANGLFNSRLHVLDRTKYKAEVLLFFSKMFEVRSKPSIDDYCALWKEWENSRRSLSVDECQVFWWNFTMFSNSKNENLISQSVNKVPASSDGSNDVLLLSKHDLFIPDDLLLKDLFEKSSSNPIFVWYPQKKSPSISRLRLFHLYSKIGVRKISEAATKFDLSDLKSTPRNPVQPKDVHIVKGLVMLILGFLSDPELKIEAKDRHNAIKRLLNAKFFEVSQCISTNYSLKKTTGDVLEVSANQMVCWSREGAEFISQKLDRSGPFKNVVEYATMFSQVVSRGVLWEEDLIPRLIELIKFGFLMDFDEDAVVYFMKTKNLQIFVEDEEFLSSSFPSS